MTLGVADRQANLFDDVEQFCDKVLDESSIYSFMHRERDRLFPDEEFADLFDDQGRRSVPPSVVATVMVLQRLEGLSDREAVDRYCFDNRWRYATGVGWIRHRWLDELFPHRARRHARTPASIRAPRPHLRRGALCGQASRPRRQPPGARLDAAL